MSKEKLTGAEALMRSLQDEGIELVFGYPGGASLHIYDALFNRFDLLLMIKVPSMEHVYESRWLQEQTLAKTLKDPELKKKIMNKQEVFRFVMHYERLTRYILEEMPSFADIVLERDKGFNFSFLKTP